MQYEEEADIKINFPCRFTFNLVRYTATGEQKVSASQTNNEKVKLENIKYTDVKHFSWTNEQNVALLGVHDVASEEELKQIFERYSVWEIKL